MIAPQLHACWQVITQLCHHQFSMFQQPRVSENYSGCLCTPDTRFETRRPADGAHGVHSWDEHGYYEPHSILATDATWRGGYRALTKPGQHRGTLDELRRMQYYGLNGCHQDVLEPTILSPFHRAEPSEYGHDLGHTHNSDNWQKTTMWHVSMTPEQRVARRLGNREPRDEPQASEDAKDPITLLSRKVTALAGEIEDFPSMQNAALGYRGAIKCGPDGSPYPGDHNDRLKAEAKSRVEQLQEALRTEKRGLAKCY